MIPQEAQALGSYRRKRTCKGKLRYDKHGKAQPYQGHSRKSFTDDSGKIVEMPVLEVEAGVVTENAMHYASSKGFVFATDPTSSWGFDHRREISQKTLAVKQLFWEQQ